MPVKHLFYKRKCVLSRAAVLAANATSDFCEYPEERLLRRGNLAEAPLLIKYVFAQTFVVLGSVPLTCLHDSADCSNRYPENRLAITTLRTPDARFAQSKGAIVRFQSYAPTLRCRCVVTTRLQPFGKGNDFSPTPHGQRTLL